MLFSLFSGGNPKDILINLLLTIPVLILALTVHEVAHGYVALKCGDRTAYNLGRLTLNPIRHLDPIGLLAMLVFGYGWAKPVPVNTRNFRNPKFGMAITAAAGPLSNLLMGLISAVFMGFFLGLYRYLDVTGAASFLVTCVWVLLLLCQYGAIYNFLFMAFNLIPVPPFDGSRIVFVFLPQRLYFKMMQYERQIMFGVLIALLALSYFNFSPFSWIAMKLTNLVYAPVAQFFLGVFF